MKSDVTETTDKVLFLSRERIIIKGISRKAGTPTPLTAMTCPSCPAPQCSDRAIRGQGEMTGQTRRFLQLPPPPAVGVF